MMETVFESGFARVEAGDWLMGLSQPAATLGAVRARGLKGFLVPDRACVRAVACSGASWCGAADRPFLTRLDALPDATLSLVSSKLLVAPLAARTGARCRKPVPLSLMRVTPVTEFRSGWAVAATAGRVTRVALEDGATLTVRTECVVAWTGNAPTGFCPRLSVLDILLPRGPRELAWRFHGPSVVWFEGSREAVPVRRGWRR